MDLSAYQQSDLSDPYLPAGRVFVISGTILSHAHGLLIFTGEINPIELHKVLFKSAYLIVYIGPCLHSMHDMSHL